MKVQYKTFPLDLGLDLKIRFEGFPIIFKKQETPQKNLFWIGFCFILDLILCSGVSRAPNHDIQCSVQCYLLWSQSNIEFKISFWNEIVKENKWTEFTAGLQFLKPGNLKCYLWKIFET